MKALYQSSWFRFVLLLMLAAFVAAGAAIPVGATDSVYIKFQGIKSGSNNVSLTDLSAPSFAYDTPILRISGNFDSNTVYSFAIVVNDYNSLSNLSVVRATVNNTNLTSYQPLTGQNLTDYSIETIYFNGNQKTVIVTFNTSNLDFIGNRYVYFEFNSFNTSTTTKITISSSNYVQGDTDSIVAANKINNNLNSISQSINNNILESADKIVNQLNNIDTDSIVQLLQQIFTYGSDYNQIDQTTINNFGTAQDNLSSAEGALQDKSQSLRDGVSSQWQNNINTTKNFVSTITPATTAITSTMTQIVAVMPEEVQALLVVIPLLLFIGWLIGRIEGG